MRLLAVARCVCSINVQKRLKHLELLQATHTNTIKVF